jgi:ATPase
VAETLVPDTSVLIDGRITELLEAGGHDGCTVLVPLAAIAELEAQANRGLETGVAGLDELSRLQQMADEGRITVETVGERPPAEEVRDAFLGAIDARIRDTAAKAGATFVTSDRVQAHAARAQGIDHKYLRPIVEESTDLTGLELWSYFDETTMSVHLRADAKPMVKKGTPAGVSYEPFGSPPSAHTDLRRIIKECIEFAKRDYRSFVEMEKNGCTVLQMGPMRVTIAQPPFSDALELTAVRPVYKATIDDYELSEDILDRIQDNGRGVFVAGAPGSGKSTFVAAVGEWLHGMNRVVKTMEQPRDLQVPADVTQYGALNGDMEWTGEVMLLVRPDHVLYDEVRTTKDFTTFADMRMAGIGLFGVTHASRPIDSIQRLIGRVELGMISQVVDTVLFIDKGKIDTILELRFTVKAPAGVAEDLARPVVIVRNVITGEDEYEIYTFGEQVVVMPLADVESSPNSGASVLAEKELHRALKRYIEGRYEVSVHGNRAKVMVEEWEIPNVIGRGGKTVQGLEQKLGIHLDVTTFPKVGAPGGAGRRSKGANTSGVETVGRGPIRAKVRIIGSNIFVMVPPTLAGVVVNVTIEGSPVGHGKSSQQGKVRFKSDSPEGMALAAAVKSGLDILVS